MKIPFKTIKSKSVKFGVCLFNNHHNLSVHLLIVSISPYYVCVYKKFANVSQQIVFIDTNVDQIYFFLFLFTDQLLTSYNRPWIYYCLMELFRLCVRICRCVRV